MLASFSQDNTNKIHNKKNKMIDYYEEIGLPEGPQTFRGIRQVDGTREGFSTDELEDGYLYLVRTTDSKQYGYVFLNGKKYGDYPLGIDCGTY